MTKIAEIRSTIGRLHGWKLRIFAAGCAEHVAPVFRQLAAPTSIRVFEEALDSAWAGATNDKTNLSPSLKSISGLPEAIIDDSNRREYYATLSLEVLEQALRANFDRDAHDAADLACCLVLDVYASFDGIALGSPNMVIDPGNSPPKGALESVEIDSLASSLAILTGESERRDDICGQVQMDARKSAQVLAQALPELIRRRYGS